MRRGRRRALVAVVSLVVIVLVGPFLVPVPALEGTVDPRTLAGPDGRFARVGAIDVHHEIRGEGEPAVLLLHHFFGGVFTWRHVAPAIGEVTRTVAFDRAGFGLTSRPLRRDWTDGNPYTRAAQVALAVGLMDTLGIERAVLVGVSTGGTIAIETTLAHPDRIVGLVLINPAIDGDVGPARWTRPVLRTPQARHVGRLFTRRVARGAREHLARSWADPSRVTEADLAPYLVPLQVDHWDAGLYELVTAEAPPRLSVRLHELDVPTLVVAGAGDRTVEPYKSRLTSEYIRGAEHVVLPECGHVPQEECPEALLNAILPFVERALSAADPARLDGG